MRERFDAFENKKPLNAAKLLYRNLKKHMKFSNSAIIIPLIINLLNSKQLKKLVFTSNTEILFILSNGKSISIRVSDQILSTNF